MTRRWTWHNQYQRIFRRFKYWSSISSLSSLITMVRHVDNRSIDLKTRIYYTYHVALNFRALPVKQFARNTDYISRVWLSTRWEAGQKIRNELAQTREKDQERRQPTYPSSITLQKFENSTAVPNRSLKHDKQSTRRGKRFTSIPCRYF